MKRLPALAALIAFAAMPGALGQAWATDYINNPNPACRVMRNSGTGAPYPPEPNREETRQAMYLAHGDADAFGNVAVVRRDYAQALALLQRIDGEGTDALASLPPDTPHIDNVIDRQVIGLSWARAMLGLFYEQGRVSRVDYAQAAAFYQKSVDTRFIDDRGCAHWAQPATMTLMHLAGILAYSLGGNQDRAQARAALLRGGSKTASAVYLLDQDALPQTYGLFLADDLDALAETVRNPPPTETQLFLALAGRVVFWVAVAVVLFVGAVGSVRFIRRRLGYKTEASLYRAAFAAYDAIHGLIARFGLVAEGLIGCFVGLSILFGAFAFGNLGSIAFNAAGFGVSYDFIVIVSGLTALLGGVAKLIEAARVSAAPGNTLVHGAARPAGEAEAHAAARGTTKAADLHSRTFKE